MAGDLVRAVLDDRKTHEPVYPKALMNNPFVGVWVQRNSLA
jgi:hypothetical protein